MTRRFCRVITLKDGFAVHAESLRPEQQRAKPVYKRKAFWAAVITVYLVAGYAGYVWLVPLAHERMVGTVFDTFIPPAVRYHSCQGPCILNAAVIMGNNDIQNWNLDLREGTVITLKVGYVPDRLDQAGHSYNGPVSVRLFYRSEDGSLVDYVSVSLGETAWNFEATWNVTMAVTQIHTLEIPASLS